MGPFCLHLDSVLFVTLLLPVIFLGIVGNIFECSTDYFENSTQLLIDWGGETGCRQLGCFSAHLFDQ